MYNKFKEKGIAMNKTEYYNRILFDRKNKDKFFKNHPQSPIPIKDKNQFEGLDYYEPNMNYRFILELKELEEKKSIKVNDTGGNVRDMLIWGEFHFKIGNTECSLQAYKSVEGEERLFVPFKDKTNGKETYGAGKYLDLIYGKDQTEDGKWILDLNNATNPWCAYSENYACPFVPPANWLDVEIKAGEKKYPLGH